MSATVGPPSGRSIRSSTGSTFSINFVPKVALKSLELRMAWKCN